MDRFADTNAADNAADDHDMLRARHWGLLARLLAGPPDAALLQTLSTVTGDTSALGQAYQVLARKASGTTAAVVEREFFELFIGVGRGALLPIRRFI